MRKLRSVLPFARRGLSFSRCFSVLKVSKKSDGRAGGTGSADDENGIRNIGILAHIDAGKTTTTERMLFCSGATRCLGDVDDGDTVTDYMDQERQRGITITSAGVTFAWKQRQINLIDTPGHVDFTFEVERVLRALDGAVTVLDASAGVEAQTLTVWDQARRYSLASIAFLNKMDKENADVDSALHSIEKRLDICPILAHAPCGSSGKTFHGVVDLVSLRKHVWKRDESIARTNIECVTSDRAEWEQDVGLMDESLRLRETMLTRLADCDDDFATKLIEAERIHDVAEDEILAAMRRATLRRAGLCVFLGSALRNVGVQPLLDAVVDLLPSPAEAKPSFVRRHFDGQLCAVAFKIVYDPLLGFLTFLRVFNGSLKPGQRVLVPRTERHERVGKLFKSFGGQLLEVDSAAAGSIAVATGLKDASTGDLLCHAMPRSATEDVRWGEDVGSMLQIPEPVFFSSVEAGSVSQQKALDSALERLRREDPSIAVRIDEDTGQTVIGGMGELHLEITKERLRRDYEVEAYMGPLQVAYRETISSEVTDSLEFIRVLGDRKHSCTLTMTAYPREPDDKSGEERGKRRLIRPWRSADTDENLNAVKPYQWKAVEQGLVGALRTGPAMSFPVVGVAFYLKWFQAGPGTSPVMISAAASQLAQQLLKQADALIMEPVMDLELIVDEDHLSSVMADLSSRRGVVAEIGVRRSSKVVKARAPLAELVGYSTAFRRLSSGLGTFSMHLGAYAALDSLAQQRLSEKMLGFSPS